MYHRNAYSKLKPLLDNPNTSTAETEQILIIQNCRRGAIFLVLMTIFEMTKSIKMDDLGLDL